MSARRTVRCASADETRHVAGALASLARPGLVVELVGPLGAGKTTFAKGYATALGVTTPVTSPSFALLHHYRCGPGAPVAVLLHADLWRLGDGEVGDLALDELLDEDATALVEWGDRAEAAPGRDRLVVTFEVLDESRRALEIDPTGAGISEGALDAACAGLAP